MAETSIDRLAAHIAERLNRIADISDIAEQDTPPLQKHHWRTLAACKDVDSNVFFPVGRGKVGDLARARAFCHVCPSRKPCLDEALQMSSYNDIAGVRGGTTHKERERIRDSLAL